MSRNASANPVRGNAILARTEQLAALVTLPPVPWFRGRGQSPGPSRLQHNRRLRATAARTGASAATWQAPLARFTVELQTRGDVLSFSRGQRFFGVGLFDTNGSSSRFETRRAKGRASRCSRPAAWLASSHSAL